jgi:hypothetical protein
MSHLVHEAIEILKDLPDDQQQTVARAILDYASHDDGQYHLTDEERGQVRAGLAEVRRGEIASDEDVADVYSRIGGL